MRLGCQFHWQNKNYHNFDDFLSTLTSQKRKKIKRERRMVREQGIELEVLHGNEMSEAQWDVYHQFYSSTFTRKSGYATLSKDFFMEIGESMASNVVVVLGRYQGEYIAGAFNLRSDDTLYGRHWGCVEEYSGLHFEVCYYRGIEYCIAKGIKRFEAGAQGEFKVRRGFRPVLTRSAHWIAAEEFRPIVADFVAREHAAVVAHMDEMNAHLPFRGERH